MGENVRTWFAGSHVELGALEVEECVLLDGKLGGGCEVEGWERAVADLGEVLVIAGAGGS